MRHQKFLSVLIQPLNVWFESSLHGESGIFQDMKASKFQLEFYVIFFPSNWQSWGYGFLRMFLSLYLSVTVVQAGSLDAFHSNTTTKLPGKPLWQLRRLMACALPSHQGSDRRAGRGGYSQWHGSDGESSSRMNRVKNGKCSPLTAFHAWHTSEAILSDNIIKVSGGLGVLFCLLYYEDAVAVSSWMIPRITFWSGNASFQKGAVGFPLCVVVSFCTLCVDCLLKEHN